MKNNDLWKCSVCGKQADCFFIRGETWCPECVLKHGGEFERDEESDLILLTKKPKEKNMSEIEPKRLIR